MMPEGGLLTQPAGLRPRSNPKRQTMTTEQKASYLLSATVSFLALKHKVSEADIVKAITDKNARICNQFAELLTTGINAMADCGTT